MCRLLIATMPLLITACSTSDLVLVDTAPVDDDAVAEPGADEVNDEINDDAHADVHLELGNTARWRCVGPPSTDLQVLRLALQPGSQDEILVAATTAPQFLRHGLVELDTTTPPATQRWTLALETDAARTMAVLQGDGRVLTVRATQPALASAVLREGDTTIELDCWDEAALATALPAVYDEHVGHCVDDDGDGARNTIALAVVQETGRGACVDFGAVRLNGDDLGYPVLQGWDLRGATLDGASLSFAALLDADLRGAQLSQLGFGYAHISGTIDERTAPPAPCTVDDDRITCQQ